VSSTVVALVGRDATAITGRLRGHSNVRVVLADADQPPLERAGDVWAKVRQGSSPYVVHDADPLEWMRQEGVALFDQQAAAPVRVVPIAATASAIVAALSQLRAGKWWPEPLDALPRNIDRVIPEQVHRSTLDAVL
jgi:hypothetical protein